MHIIHTATILSTPIPVDEPHKAAEDFEYLSFNYLFLKIMVFTRSVLEKLDDITLDQTSISFISAIKVYCTRLIGFVKRELGPESNAASAILLKIDNLIVIKS